MDPEIELVIASYHRARHFGLLFDAFYDIFLRKSPEIPLMFAQTNFQRQKLMLRESILEMLHFARNGTGRSDIEKLGERHQALQVKPIHYDLWLDALCEALAEQDPEFNAELETLWRKTMRKGIDIMCACPK
jgi:hemoglobin-like flavoprotein